MQGSFALLSPIIWEKKAVKKFCLCSRFIPEALSDFSYNPYLIENKQRKIVFCKKKERKDVQEKVCAWAQHMRKSPKIIHFYKMQGPRS